MTQMKLTVRGVIFALYPHYSKTNPNSDEMEMKTTEQLAWLDRERPEVILVPEPDNIHTSKAVRVYCNGAPMGYVAHEEAPDASRLFDALHPMVPARIVQVEVQRKGNYYVEAELPAHALVKPIPQASPAHAWEGWKCTVPKLAMPDEWVKCRILEFQAERLFEHPDELQVKLLKNLMKVWTDKSLHDFSVEAMQQRKRYIARLRTLGLEENAQLLQRQYVGISSSHRMATRMKWWKELQQSEAVEHYWGMWRSSRKEDNLWHDLYMVDTQLRRMPDGLYGYIGDLSCLFSALRYRDDVTRSVLWDIYTLLLLRERICRELGIPMKPRPLNSYGMCGDEEEACTPELTDVRLVRAVEACQPFFWAKSAWAVVFCVCRDCFGVADCVSAFEKRIMRLELNCNVREYTEGTIHTALCNNAFMKKPVGKWEEGRALTLAKELMAMLEER